MTEATAQIPGNPGAGAPRGETIKLSLAAGMFWALAMLGLYAQPQLVESIMADHGVLEGAVGQMFSFENGSFFITLLLASGPIARMSRARTALAGPFLPHLEISLARQPVKHRVERSRTDLVAVLAKLLDHPTAVDLGGGGSRSCFSKYSKRAGHTRGLR